MEWLSDHSSTFAMLCVLTVSIILFYYLERKRYTAPKGHVRVCFFDGKTLCNVGDFPNVEAVVLFMRTQKYDGHVIMYNDDGQTLV